MPLFDIPLCGTGVRTPESCACIARFPVGSTVRGVAGLKRGGDILLVLFAPVSHSNTSFLQQWQPNLVSTCSNICGPALS